jgi:hypothetical protein
MGIVVLLLERFPNIKTLCLRTDGSGNFRNSSFVLLMSKISQWTGVNIVEFSVSEAGGGKDLTDSLIMQQKQSIREGVNQTGGSEHNPTKCVATVQKGEEQVGSRGSCPTREMIYNRTSSGVNGDKKEALPDISTIYHYEYEFTEVDVSESQIKSWFSSEVGYRKKAVVNRVIEKGFTELSQSMDIQDNEEGGHHQHEGVVEEGVPPPSPPPPPPPPPSL